jgi:hypothetical protein
LSSSSDPSPDAPKGFTCEELLRTLEVPGEAKLVNPDPIVPADAKPLPKPPLPPIPEPRLANPVEVPVFAKGDGPEEAAKPAEAGFSPDVAEAVLKTDGALAVLPRAPKGDWSDPAKEARPDEANADDEVVRGDLKDRSLSSGDLEPASDTNGETADVFMNALGKDDWDP